jgi:hypothetical protein
MVISQSKLNPLTRNQDFLDERIQSLLPPKGVSMSDMQRHELEMAKESLAVVSGLYARNPREVRMRLGTLHEAVVSGTLDDNLLNAMRGEGDAVSAEEIYVNRKVLDLVSKAEMEREDWRKASNPPNVFFGTQKIYFKTKFNTIWINSLVILFNVVLIIGALQISLKRQLTRV